MANPTQPSVPSPCHLFRKHFSDFSDTGLRLCGFCLGPGLSPQQIRDSPRAGNDLIHPWSPLLRTGAAYKKGHSEVGLVNTSAFLEELTRLGYLIMATGFMTEMGHRE